MAAAAGAAAAATAEVAAAVWVPGRGVRRRNRRRRRRQRRWRRRRRRRWTNPVAAEYCLTALPFVIAITESMATTGAVALRRHHEGHEGYEYGKRPHEKKRGQMLAAEVSMGKLATTLRQTDKQAEKQRQTDKQTDIPNEKPSAGCTHRRQTSCASRCPWVPLWHAAR